MIVFPPVQNAMVKPICVQIVKLGINTMVIINVWYNVNSPAQLVRVLMIV